MGQRFLLVLGGNDGYKASPILVRKCSTTPDSPESELSPPRQPLADAWALDTAVKPYRWTLVEATGDGPGARMYAAAAARADGLLLVCGGRDASNMPLVRALRLLLGCADRAENVYLMWQADVYGLARHRDGRWEWAAAPGVAPTPRYQHSAACIGARLHVSGGALGGGKMVDEKHSVVVLDTAAGRRPFIPAAGSADRSYV